MTGRAEFAEHQSPARVLCDALMAAEQGIMPTFTSDELLHTLKLDGDIPDGLSLVQRFTDGDVSLPNLRATQELMGHVDELIDSTNVYRANPAEEVIAQAFGAVVTRQVTREDELCPGAAHMALSSTREDIIPESLVEQVKIKQQAAEQEMIELMEMLGSIASEIRFEVGPVIDGGQFMMPSPTRQRRFKRFRLG